MSNIDSPRLPGRVIERLLRQTLEDEGVTRIAVSGESMRPWLVPGDRIEIVPVEIESARPGDILLFEGLVVHRLLERTDLGLIARGDAVQATDPIWPPHKVIGRVTARLREGHRTEVDRGLSRVLSGWHTRRWRWRRRIAQSMPRLTRTR